MKILIISPNWIGDLIVANSLFKLIKQKNYHLSVAAPNYCRPLLERMHEVDEIFESPVTHNKLNLKKIYQFSQQLKQHKFDQAVVLPNSLKSSLVPFLANIPKRTGYLGEFRYLLLNNIKKITSHNYKNLKSQCLFLFNNNDLEISQAPNPSLIINKKNIDNLIKKLNINLNKKILILAPGAAFGDAKQWPAEYFAKISREKYKDNWQVIILGSAKDKEIANQINNLVNNICLNLCGITNIKDAIDIISISNYVISNDSGLMHIAAALDKNLIAIYGSSTPNFTPPLSNKAIILEDKDLDCRPCFKRTCPYGHKNCMYNITPDKVKSLIN